MRAQSKEAVQVVGFRARRGPFPGLALPLSPGLTALYGLNGAGKTTVLDAIRDCYAGRCTAQERHKYSQMLVKAQLGSTLRNAIQVAILPGFDTDKWAIREFHRDDPDRDDSDHQTLARAVLAGFGRRHQIAAEEPRTEILFRENPEDLEAIAKELSFSPYFALVPVGGLGAEWEVWLCMPADPSEAPQASGLLDRLSKWARDVGGLWEATNPDDKDWHLLYEITNELLRHPFGGWAWYHRESDDPLYGYMMFRSPLWSFLEDGLPIPVVRICTLRGRIPMRLLDEEAPIEVGRLTAAAFSERFLDARWVPLEGGGHREVEAPEVVAITDDMRVWTVDLERRVNRTYQALLRDAPVLHLALDGPATWLAGPGLTWTAERRGIDRLSAAQSRWAKFAIALELDNNATVALIDEPEAALHRAAEAHMAEGLSKVALEIEALVAATHSPRLLDDPTTNLVEVARLNAPPVGRPRTELEKLQWGQETELAAPAVTRPLAGPDRGSLDRLGLLPSDLLALYRVFVLVEGEHDVAVLETLLRDVLNEARARVVAVRGASNLAFTADSEVLYHHTDAHLIAVLDRVRHDQVEEAWTEAQARFLADGVDAAVESLDRALRGRGGGTEYQAIRDWLAAALRSGAPDRFKPDGLTAPDILDYLPVAALVPSSTLTWPELREEHASVRSHDKNVPKDFKVWLREYKEADISTGRVRAVAEALKAEPGEANVPEDIRNLGYRIREVAHRQTKASGVPTP